MCFGSGLCLPPGRALTALLGRAGHGAAQGKAASWLSHQLPAASSATSFLSESFSALQTGLAESAGESFAAYK